MWLQNDMDFMRRIGFGVCQGGECVMHDDSTTILSHQPEGSSSRLTAHLTASQHRGSYTGSYKVLQLLATGGFLSQNRCAAPPRRVCPLATSAIVARRADRVALSSFKTDWALQSAPLYSSLQPTPASVH